MFAWLDLQRVCLFVAVNQVSNNNHIYNAGGPGYSTTPRPSSASSYSPSTPPPSSHSPVVATGGRIITEVPINEPDLSRKPVRSALKGGKNKEMFQRQLADKLKERQLQQQLSMEGAGAGDEGSRPGTLTRGGPPITAPKPKKG